MTLSLGAFQEKLPFTKFHGHRHCDIGDIMVLAGHVMSQDHVIKGLWNFMGSSPSR